MIATISPTMLADLRKKGEKLTLIDVLTTRLAMHQGDTFGEHLQHIKRSLADTRVGKSAGG